MNVFSKTSTAGKSIFLTSLLIILFSATLEAQNFPKEIRGYKIYKAEIAVKNRAEKDDGKSSQKSENSEKPEVFVKVGEPELIDFGLKGITLSLTAELDAVRQSGEVDFLTFYDFRVNGLAVKIEEYRKSFVLVKNEKIVLPKPIKIFVGTGQTLRGAVSEWSGSQAEWTVTGRIFVFGRFKKAGFKFKRVVPVEINLKVKNPLHSDSKFAEPTKINSVAVAVQSDFLPAQTAR